MIFVPTPALNDAMLVGGLLAALDDDAINHAYAVIQDAGSVALVTLLFAKPAAALVAHELVFAQDDSGGDQIMTEGDAVGFEVYSGSGVLLAIGDVSNAAGSGALKIIGTAGTHLYAGGRAVLAEMKFA